MNFRKLIQILHFRRTTIWLHEYLMYCASNGNWKSFLPGNIYGLLGECVWVFVYVCVCVYKLRVKLSASLTFAPNPGCFKISFVSFVGVVFNAFELRASWWRQSVINRRLFSFFMVLLGQLFCVLTQSFI